MPVVLALAEVLGAKKFLRANDLRALPGGGSDALQGAGEIRGRMSGTAGLDQSQRDRGRRVEPGFSRLQVSTGGGAPADSG